MAGNAFAANVEAPDMTVHLAASSIEAASFHIRAPSAKKPIAITYGAPGAGKSAFAQTMVDLINRFDPKTNTFYHPPATAGGAEDESSSSSVLDGEVAWLKGTAAMHDVDDTTVRDFAVASRDTLALVISFNGRSECLKTESEEAMSLGIPWLPVASRLLYQYFGSFMSRSKKFSYYRDDLLALLRDELFRVYFKNYCNPDSLIDLLRSKHGKTKIALYVDETMKACEYLTQNDAEVLIKVITALQDNGVVSTFFTGLRYGPFLKVSSSPGRRLSAHLLPTITEDRHAEFFPPEGLGRLLPPKVRLQSRKEDIDRTSMWLSRYLFSLAGGYPRMVEIMARACSASRTLPEVLKAAMVETGERYSSGVTPSALALGALHVPVPRSLIVRSELPCSDLASRDACRQLLRDVDSEKGSVPAGYVALDEMVSRGMVFIEDPGAQFKTVSPFVPPLHLLATFREKVARADARAAGALVSELLEELRKRSLNENVVHALALAAARRLELLPDAAVKKFKCYREALAQIVDCNTTEALRKMKGSLVLELKYLVEVLLDDTMCNFDGSWLEELCTLVSDARGMVGDASLLAMCQGSGTNEGFQQTIHEVNSRAIERWHARYECMMRRLNVDADQYLPDANKDTSSFYTKPDYSKRLLSEHYRAADRLQAHLRSARFDWTQPLEMEMDVSTLPDYSDAESLANATGKMLVMSPGFAGCDLAWVAHRVDDEGRGEPVLFLEQHKLQVMGTSAESLSAVTKNLKLALAAAKAAHWDPKKVVYVVKSTRPLPGGGWIGAIKAEKESIMSNASLSQRKRVRLIDTYESGTLSVWESTNAVLLCGESGLGAYLGPMLWSCLTAGGALGPVPMSSRNGDYRYNR
jgi:hypothetical protein